MNLKAIIPGLAFLILYSCLADNNEAGKPIPGESHTPEINENWFNTCFLCRTL
jgi:hypothetical protein